MAPKTYIVWTCAHADPKYSNERFSWLGQLIYDLKPDVCIDLGDGADVRSLNSYDTKKPEAIANTAPYQEDISSYNDSQERLRHLFKKNKVRKPKWYGFEGNHENRIKKALSLDPRLEGEDYGISFSHLNTEKWFNEYHEYENGAPAIWNYGGVDYAHFISSGNYGTAMSGEWHASNLIKKRLTSTTVGHSHFRDIKFRDDAKGIGCVAGCFKGGSESWAGQAQQGWWRGVIIKHNYEGGYYDPQWVSMEQLEREYG